MTGPQRRFHSLARLFMHRMIDNEMLASNAEPHRTLVTAIALLGGIGLTFSFMMLPRHALGLGGLPRPIRNLGIWSDELLLLLIGAMATGLLASFAWSSIFPDRRDAFILGSLPIPLRTITGARLYSIAVYFAVLTFALHIVPWLGLSLVTQYHGATFGTALRAYAAHGITVVMLGICVFASTIAVQSVFLLLLPWRLYERASSFTQIVVMLTSFGMFFLHPGVTDARGIGRDWAYLLPPFWFLDLWHALAGADRMFATITRAPLAQWAVIATAMSLVGATVGVLLGLPTAIHKAVEGIESRRSGPPVIVCALTRLLDSTLLRDVRQRAVFWFAARTVTRHRGHRLLFCLYVGLALAAMLTSLSSLIYGEGQWSYPNEAVLSAMFFLSILMSIGMRALYALPVELKANWTFQLAAGKDTMALVGGARKLMALLGVMPILLLFPVCVGLWGLKAAAIAVAWVSLITLVFCEYLLRTFRSIPFTCAWMPGQANLKVKLGVWGLGLSSSVLMLSAIGVTLTRQAGARRLLVVFAITTMLWLFPVLRRRFSETPMTAPEYEPPKIVDIMPLELNT